MKKALKCDFRQEQVHELPMFDCQRTHAAFERSNLEALNKSSLISVQGTLVGYLVTRDIVCPLHQTNKKEQKIKKLKIGFAYLFGIPMPPNGCRPMYMCLG